MTPDLLAQVWANPSQRPDLTPREWETILGQARQARLLGRLAHHHVRHDWMHMVPAGPRDYLDGALRLVDRQHREVQWEVACIQRALAHVPTPVVMLKGAAYFVAGLPPRHGRLFSDIDILVARERISDVEGALFRSGWISEEHDAYNDRYYRQWMHEIPPLRHVRRGTVIDVHHTIAPPTSRFKVDGAKLLAHKVAIDGMDGLYILSPADMVLHSATHLFQDGEFDHGLRDLLDLNDLLLHFGESPLFWDTLFARSQELGLDTPLFHALHHVGRLFGMSCPSDLKHKLESIRPGWPYEKLMDALLVLALRPNHPSCDRRFSKLARWLLYVRSHYLRMPMHQVVPHLIRKAWMRQFPEKRDAMANG
jgi:hypothetical protein